jgi:hypothetical protein
MGLKFLSSVALETSGKLSGGSPKVLHLFVPKGKQVRSLSHIGPVPFIDFSPLFLNFQGTGNVVEAVRHERAVMSEIRKASVMNEEELYAFAAEIRAPFHLVKEVARLKRLPVVNFAAGGIATPGMQVSVTRLCRN